MTNSSLKQDPNQLTIFVHPWYEELNKLENTTPCEFGLTLKQSVDPVGLRSIEWAAGIYEGEGTLSKKTSCNSWKMAVKMTDFDIVKDFHRVVDAGSLGGPYHSASMKSHYLPYYTWATYNKDLIFKVICDFYPYMGERRRAKFDEFLSTNGPFKN
jgi:hypothetical protein